MSNLSKLATKIANGPDRRSAPADRPLLLRLGPFLLGLSLPNDGDRWLGKKVIFILVVVTFLILVATNSRVLDLILRLMGKLS